MPKQVKIIDDFSGGENSFVGSRKIQDNELTKLQNLTVGASGVIRSGTVGTAAISATVGNGLDPYPTTISTTIKDGHNLFSFSFLFANSSGLKQMTCSGFTNTSLSTYFFVAPTS